MFDIVIAFLLGGIIGSLFGFFVLPLIYTPKK